MDKEENVNRLIEDFKFLKDNFFVHSKYLKINNRYVVSFDADRLMIGDKERAFIKLREEMKKEGIELYLISDIMGYWETPQEDSGRFNIPATLNSIDAFSAAGIWHWTNEYARTHFWEFLTHLYDGWDAAAKELNKIIIPVTMPGLELAEIIKEKLFPDFIDLPYDPDRMKKLLELGIKYSPIQKIVSFNEWMAAHAIEPSFEYGFEYLDVLKKTLEI
jgi:hypothetical protein